MSLVAECLATVTGLWPGKSEPSERDRIAADGMVDRWRSKLTKWLRHPDEVAPFDWPDPPDEADLREKILRPILPDEGERLIAFCGDHDLGREYVAVLQAGRDQLNTRLPKIPVPNMSGELFPISDEDLANVWNMTRMLDDSGALLDEILAYSVTVDMVDVWKLVYPELSAAVVKILEGDGVTDYGLLVDLHADGKRLSWQQEDVIKMLIGRKRDEVPAEKEEQKQEQNPTPKTGTTNAIEHATKGDFRP